VSKQVNDIKDSPFSSIKVCNFSVKASLSASSSVSSSSDAALATFDADFLESSSTSSWVITSDLFPSHIDGTRPVSIYATARSIAVVGKTITPQIFV
jgi:hypothetical protein